MGLTKDTLPAYHEELDRLQLGDDLVSQACAQETISHFVAIHRAVLAVLRDAGLLERLNPALLGLFSARFRPMLSAFIADNRSESVEVQPTLLLAREAFVKKFVATEITRRALIELLRAVATQDALNNESEELKKLRELYEREKKQMASPELRKQLAATRRRLKAALKERDEAEKKAGLDPLLGMNNVASFEARCALARTKEAEEDLVVFFWDIDHFRDVNNTYGHAAGDAVLQQVTMLLYRHFRNTDVFRKGGEELVCVERSTSGGRDWEQVGMDFLEEVRAHDFVLPDGRIIHITISGGLARGKGKTLYNAATTPSGEESLLERADKLMYASKQGGRDCLTVEEAAA